jgi:hypothetical protein
MIPSEPFLPAWTKIPFSLKGENFIPIKWLAFLQKESVLPPSHSLKGAIHGFE